MSRNRIFQYRKIKKMWQRDIFSLMRRHFVADVGIAEKMFCRELVGQTFCSREKFIEELRVAGDVLWKRHFLEDTFSGGDIFWGRGDILWGKHFVGETFCGVDILWRRHFEAVWCGALIYRECLGVVRLWLAVRYLARTGGACRRPWYTL